MYKQDKAKKEIPYVYSIFAYPPGAKKANIMVMNNCIPVFTDEETMQDFIEKMVVGRFPPETNIVIKKVVITEYKEDGLPNNNKKSR